MEEPKRGGLILSRIARALREQNWTAVALEFTIVTLGVLLGSVVAQWNADRQEQAQVRELLSRLTPVFEVWSEDVKALEQYFESRAALAEATEQMISQEGNEAELVKAAFLSSSFAVSTAYNGDTFALQVGSDILPRAKDADLRAAIVAAFQTLAHPELSFESYDTDFRDFMVGVVPLDVQSELVSRCNAIGLLPEVEDVEQTVRSVAKTDCPVDLAPDVARPIAEEIRSDPDALEHLRAHHAVLKSKVKRFATLRVDVENAIEQLERTD
ncbi:MAG: hypothetical protein AAF291_12250 [Pseudomonadota bacterium]